MTRLSWTLADSYLPYTEDRVHSSELERLIGSLESAIRVSVLARTGTCNIRRGTGRKLVLAYGCRLHPIDTFLSPSPSGRGERRGTRDIS